MKVLVDTRGSEPSRNLPSCATDCGPLQTNPSTIKITSALPNTLIVAANTVQGAKTDFLLCVCAVRWGMPIFTIDQDFKRYSQYLPIKLYEPRNELPRGSSADFSQ